MFREKGRSRIGKGEKNLAEEEREDGGRGGSGQPHGAWSAIARDHFSNEI